MKTEKNIRSIAYAFTALWGYAGTVKLISWTQSRAEMHKQPFPETVADVFFWAIPLLELGIVVLLLVPKLRLWGLRASLALITVFTLYLALVLGRAFGSIPCACGGILSGMGHAAHLVFNSFFVILGCIAMVLARKGRHGDIANPGVRRKEGRVFSG
ncbi:hypothetical protein GCM10011386_12760 [Parapedobacter defluvii]|uniref:Methylamine utilisation protein MauE domain-containing protein n=1 Tax=Parapedobacter defluvii TaxID=2045106 RepID=A0ABQ1LDS8_9SPHI|nr:MauE/DoxX family redox-associated membrane protein [Parapedobacter defluvii]GGC22270.1 hypothetical protein GCM10011386_12760 [Parapedobacter defluvii]